MKKAEEEEGKELCSGGSGRSKFAEEEAEEAEEEEEGVLRTLRMSFLSKMHPKPL